MHGYLETWKFAFFTSGDVCNVVHVFLFCPREQFINGADFFSTIHEIKSKMNINFLLSQYNVHCKINLGLTYIIFWSNLITSQARCFFACPTFLQFYDNFLGFFFSYMNFFTNIDRNEIVFTTIYATRINMKQAQDTRYGINMK